MSVQTVERDTDVMNDSEECKTSFFCSLKSQFNATLFYLTQ